MDPFWRNLPADEGNEWDMYDGEEESEQYSSEDDVGEIEEALLRKIHYAEECQEEASPFPGETTHLPVEGRDGSFYQGHVLKDFPNITLKTLRGTVAKVERTYMVDETKDVEETSKKENSLSFISEKAKRTLEPLAYSPASNSRETMDARKSAKKRKKKLREALLGDDESSLTRRKDDSDSEKESKYKINKSRNLSNQVSRNNSDSEVQIITDDSDKDFSSSRKDSKMNKLIQNNVNVISITCRDSDSDIASSGISLSQVLQSSEAVDNLELLPLTTKRHWQKSKDDPEIIDSALATTSKKVKLKRTVIDTELRTILDTCSMKENSGDDLSDTMLIESHSEDEALDVHYDSAPTWGRNNNQSLSYKRTSTRGRYYQDLDEWPRYKCYNCLEFGHMSADCPKPRQRKVITCVLCGTRGHSDRQCPDALCYICREPGHQARECPNKKFQYFTCNRCSMKGHVEKFCPDRWRQYHLTTKPGKIERDVSTKNNKLVAMNGKVYCYNCSKEGHFGHECWEEPMDRNAPLILPYVVKYDYIPMRFWRMQMDSAEPSGRTYDDQAAQQEVESIKPSTGTKKLRAKTKRRLAREAKAALAAANMESKCIAPPTAQKQKRNAKRKRERAGENIANYKEESIDDEDQLKKSKAKKCRRKTEEDREACEKLEKELSSLPKKERKRLKRENRKCHLDQEEVLDDYEETDEYVQKGGHILRKRKDSEREMYTLDLEMQRPKIEMEGTKKKKKARWTKSKRRELKKQQQELKRQEGQLKKQERELPRQQQVKQQQKQQHQQQLSLEQQRVTFQPNPEQFAVLERKYQTQNHDPNWARATASWAHATADTRKVRIMQQHHSKQEDCIEQVNSVGVLPSEVPADNKTNTGGGKKKRKRPIRSKKKCREGQQVKLNKNIQQNFLRGKELPRELSTHPKPLSKKQRRKQAASGENQMRQKIKREKTARINEQRAVGSQFMSDRGFYMNPRY